jgi:hypothetical protein
MKRQVFSSLITRSAMVLMLSPACATLRPPAQGGGPAVSSEGVQIAVARQACAQTQEPDYYANDLIETTLEVQVHNATPDPITVHRDAFRLMTPDGIALKTVTWRAVDPLTVRGGQTGTFELRFMTRGGLECAREMDLEADSGVTLRDKPIRIGGVHFVPSRTI